MREAMSLLCCGKKAARLSSSPILKRPAVEPFLSINSYLETIILLLQVSAVSLEQEKASMANRVTQGQMISQNENFNVQQKNIIFDGMNRSSKAATKKDGLRLGNRKALNDITNKSCVGHETGNISRKKKSAREFNVAEEAFLHDHKKCIEERQIAKNVFLDIVLPGHDSNPIHVEEKYDYIVEEPEEVSMSEFSDWLCSTPWNSPPHSPLNWDLPFSPSAMQLETVEFKLKFDD